jgi:iron complex outermembrane receptor protein
MYYFKKTDIFSAYGTETPTPGYGLVNVGLGTGIMRQHNKLHSVKFQITKLMKISYQSHLSRLKYAPVNPATNRVGIYNPGRSFVIKLEVPLRFK